LAATFFVFEVLIFCENYFADPKISLELRSALCDYDFAAPAARHRWKTISRPRNANRRCEMSDRGQEPPKPRLKFESKRRARTGGREAMRRRKLVGAEVLVWGITLIEKI